MNIKQAERLTGISRRNIRFYEEQGMIHPERNRENDYREYSDGDIRTLKLIRALRMVDMPLEQIRQVISGQMALNKAAAEQELRLKQREKELRTAIFFCRELGGMSELDGQGLDSVLQKMDEPDHAEHLFRSWTRDYRQVAQAQGKRSFTFLPEGSVTNEREFTAELLRFAREEEADLTITKEGMYPEFTLNGIEYTAERIYGCAYRVPVAVIRCTAKHPEELEPDLPRWKRGLFKLVHYGWLFVLALVLMYIMVGRTMEGSVAATWCGWLIVFCVGILTCMGVYRFILFFYHHRGK